jgi:hypothetical protein
MGAAGRTERPKIMRRIRSLASHTPAIALSVLALAFSAGGGAYAATQASHQPRPAAQQMHQSLRQSRLATQRNAANTAATVSFSNVHLENGWLSDNTTFDCGHPAASIQSGIVYLAGCMHQPSGTSDNFAQLPQNLRPAHNLWLPVYTFGGTEGSIEIAADGNMYAFAGDAQLYTSLAGISYPVNS